MAQQFYDKHGSKAIVLARLVPIVRTFAPIVAGIGAMNDQSFISFNVFGELIWTFGLTALGYSLGKVIPDVNKYLLPLILIIIVISLLPSLIHIYQEYKSNRS